MLLRCVIMLAAVASALALAACAESASALAGAAAEEAAAIAATQAIIASTQAVAEIQAASTQSTQPVLPNLPNTGQGVLIIDTPTAMIIQKDGHRYILVKNPPYDDTDQNH